MSECAKIYLCSNGRKEGVKYYMSTEPLTDSQHIQQAIATTITCRSIIKYSSSLNAEQKDEILAEIENTLAYLETHLTTPAPKESSANLEQEKFSEFLAREQPLKEVEEQAPAPPLEQELHESSLRELYKLYHVYLSEERMINLETRYRVVMEVIDQLQEVAGQQHNVTAGDVTTEALLHRIRGFITALYCMLREFALLLFNIVEGKSIETDTEGLALLGKYSFEVSRQEIVRDITPLMLVYTRHLQLQEQRGTLIDCARDATAFFVFLEEALGQDFARRNEVVGQLDNIATLLDALSHLLTDYEQAMSNMFAV
jgi:hypothetical protein